jgi:hypothetical protein
MNRAITETIKKLSKRLEECEKGAKVKYQDFDSAAELLENIEREAVRFGEEATEIRTAIELLKGMEEE